MSSHWVQKAENACVWGPRGRGGVSAAISVEGSSGRLRCREKGGVLQGLEAREEERSLVGERGGAVQMAGGGGGGRAGTADFSGEWRGGYADDWVGWCLRRVAGVGVGCT